MDVSKELGWKVLREEPGKPRTSIFATTGAVEYRKGRATKPWPGCGPLTVFRTYLSALGFVNGFAFQYGVVVPVKYVPYKAVHDRDFALWEPWGEVPERKPLAAIRFRGENRRRVVDRLEVTTRTKRELPRHTVLASSITCLE